MKRSTTCPLRGAPCVNCSSPDANSCNDQGRVDNYVGCPCGATRSSMLGWPRKPPGLRGYPSILVRVQQHQQGNNNHDERHPVLRCKDAYIQEPSKKKKRGPPPRMTKPIPHCAVLKKKQKNAAAVPSHPNRLRSRYLYRHLHREFHPPYVKRDPPTKKEKQQMSRERTSSSGMTS